MATQFPDSTTIDESPQLEITIDPPSVPSSKPSSRSSSRSRADTQESTPPSTSSPSLSCSRDGSPKPTPSQPLELPDSLDISLEPIEASRETSHLTFQGSLSLETENHSVVSRQSLAPPNSLETEITSEPASVSVVSDVESNIELDSEPDVEDESSINTHSKHTDGEGEREGGASTNPEFEAILQSILDEGNESDSSIVADLKKQLGKETIDSPMPNYDRAPSHKRSLSRSRASSRNRASAEPPPIEEAGLISDKRIRKQILRVLKESSDGSDESSGSDSGLDRDSNEDSDGDSDSEPESDMETEVVEPAVEPNDASLKQTYPPKPFVIKESEVNKKWQNQRYKGKSKKAIDKLMKLIGLEEVKQQSLDLISKAKIAKRQGKNRMRDQRFNIVFQGNPGTGKTTVARIYAELLYSIGALKQNQVHETSGAKLAFQGPQNADKIIQGMLKEGGGVLFVDEAYQLTASHSPGGGRQVLDILLTEMENNIGKLVVIFAGYKKEMETFFEHNPGLASRVPYTMDFADFSDAELWQILRDKIEDRYQSKMRVQGGIDGLYIRVAIRRLSRTRGVQGFGNARAVENLLETISNRQARRLVKEKDQGIKNSSLCFTKEDLIGVEPTKAMAHSKAWIELQDLIGLEEVKYTVSSMFDMLTTNYYRELAEYRPLQLSLNRVFVGNPGTGKTTVAKLYGRIMADLGLLSNGEVIIKNPSDFIGECLGKSEAKTRAILSATIGKVLIIDEAYMLNSGGDENQQDTYRRAVIDTLVAEVQGVPGDDRCVLLLGYEEKINDMFQNANPGLSRRFEFEHPFRFVNYNLKQLDQMMHLKLGQEDMTATEAAHEVALSILERASRRPNFSNASEIDTCLGTAKLNYQKRQSKFEPTEREFNAVLEPQDFDIDYQRGSTSTCRQYLTGKVADDIIKRLEDFQKLARAATHIGLDPRKNIPTQFVFKGPPGTGKTTTARSMGKVFYEMGFLSTAEVIECSSSDLIGQCVGHTGPKTKKVLERALGKVLFIDEAYRLAEGQYATEAVNELIYLLSSKNYAGRMIVILAGYNSDMDKLMMVRPGLSGLFPDEVVFNTLNQQECLELLIRELEERHVSTPFLDPPFLDPTFLDPNEHNLTHRQKVGSLFRGLGLMPSWSNARDVKTLAGQMSELALNRFVAKNENVSTLTPNLRCNKKISLKPEEATKCMKAMVHMHRTRCLNRTVPKNSACHASTGAPNQCELESQMSGAQVNDDVTAESTPTTNAHSCPKTVDIRKASQTEGPDMLGQPGPSNSHEQDVNSTPPAAVCGKIVRDEDDDDDDEDDYEVKAQKKLQQIGACVAGYAWKREGAGYRCEGGSHYISDEQLALR